MKNPKFVLVLLSGIMVVIIFSALRPQTVYAQCGLPGTPPCGGGGGDKEKKHTRTPRPTPQPTSTATSTAEPTATLESAAPITGGGLDNSNGGVPPVQNPSQGSSPFSSPGPLGMIIVVCIAGGVFLIGRRLMPPGPPAKPPNPNFDASKGFILGDDGKIDPNRESPTRESPTRESPTLNWGDDQFAKFDKVEIDSGPTQDAANQFHKSSADPGPTSRQQSGLEGNPTNDPNDVNK